jgi:hypothetical protein
MIGKFVLIAELPLHRGFDGSRSGIAVPTSGLVRDSPALDALHGPRVAMTDYIDLMAGVPQIADELLQRSTSAALGHGMKSPRSSPLRGA